MSNPRTPLEEVKSLLAKKQGTDVPKKDAKKLTTIIQKSGADILNPLNEQNDLDLILNIIQYAPTANKLAYFKIAFAKASTPENKTKILEKIFFDISVSVSNRAEAIKIFNENFLQEIRPVQKQISALIDISEQLKQNLDVATKKSLEEKMRDIAKEIGLYEVHAFNPEKLKQIFKTIDEFETTHREFQSIRDKKSLKAKFGDVYTLFTAGRIDDSVFNYVKRRAQAPDKQINPEEKIIEVAKETFGTEKSFRNDLKIFIDYFTTNNEAIREKLGPEKYTLLQEYLEPYKQLITGPFQDQELDQNPSKETISQDINLIANKLQKNNDVFSKNIKNFRDAITNQELFDKFVTKELKPAGFDLVPSSSNLNISAYIAKPFQRVLKYALLLTELQKNTSDADLKNILDTPLKDLKEISAALNEGERLKEVENKTSQEIKAYKQLMDYGDDKKTYQNRRDKIQQIDFMLKSLGAPDTLFLNIFGFDDKVALARNPNLLQQATLRQKIAYLAAMESDKVVSTHQGNKAHAPDEKTTLAIYLGNLKKAYQAEYSALLGDKLSKEISRQIENKVEKGETAGYTDKLAISLLQTLEKISSKTTASISTKIKNIMQGLSEQPSPQQKILFLDALNFPEKLLDFFSSESHPLSQQDYILLTRFAVKFQELSGAYAALSRKEGMELDTTLSITLARLKRIGEKTSPLLGDKMNELLKKLGDASTNQQKYKYLEEVNLPIENTSLTDDELADLTNFMAGLNTLKKSYNALTAREAIEINKNKFLDMAKEMAVEPIASQKSADIQDVSFMSAGNAAKAHILTLSIYVTEIMPPIGELIKYGKTLLDKKRPDNISQLDKISEILKQISQLPDQASIVAYLAQVSKAIKSQDLLKLLKPLEDAVRSAKPITKTTNAELIEDHATISISTPDKLKNYDAKKLRDELDRLENAMLSNNEPYYRELQMLYASPTIRSLLKSDKNLNDRFSSLNDISLDIVTNSLIAIDKEAFGRIAVYDFMRDTKDHQSTLAPLGKMFNGLSAHIVNDILSKDNIDERTLTFEYWIHVAERALKHPIIDCNLIFILNSAFTNSAIIRLHSTKEGLTPNSEKLLDKLIKLTSSEKSYTEIRKFYQDHENDNYIPHPGMFLSDRTFTVDGNPSVHRYSNSYAPVYDILNGLKKRLDKINRVAFGNVPSATIARDAYSSSTLNDREAFATSKRLEPSEDEIKKGTRKKVEKSKIFNDKDAVYPAKSEIVAITTEKPVAPEPDKYIIVLDSSDSSSSLILSKIFSGSEYEFFSLGNLTGFGTEQDREISTEEIDRRTSIKLNEIKNSYDNSKSDEESHKKYSYLLYCLETYGKPYTKEDVSESALKRMDKKISEYNNPKRLEEAFNKVSLMLRKQALDELISEKENIGELDPNTRPSIIKISEFSKQLFYNGENILANGKSALDSPPKIKMLAAIYLMLNKPELFKLGFLPPSTEATSEIYVRPEDRLSLVSSLINELNPDNVVDIQDLLSQTDPSSTNPEATLLDHLPKSTIDSLNTRFKEIGTSQQLDTQPNISVEKRLHDHIASITSLNDMDIDALILKNPTYFLNGEYDLDDKAPTRFKKSDITAAINARIDAKVDEILRAAIVSHDAQVFEYMLTSKHQQQRTDGNAAQQAESAINQSVAVCFLIASDLSEIGTRLNNETLNRPDKITNALTNVSQAIEIEILSEPSPARKVLALQRWITVMQGAEDNQETFSVYAIHNALHAKSISSLLPNIRQNFSTTAQTSLTDLTKKYGDSPKSDKFIAKEMKEDARKKPVSAIPYVKTLQRKIKTEKTTWMDYKTAITKPRSQDAEKIKELSKPSSLIKDKLLHPERKLLTSISSIFEHKVDESRSLKSETAKRLSTTITTPVSIPVPVAQQAATPKVTETLEEPAKNKDAITATELAKIVANYNPLSTRGEIESLIATNPNYFNERKFFTLLDNQITDENQFNNLISTITTAQLSSRFNTKTNEFAEVNDLISNDPAYFLKGEFNDLANAEQVKQIKEVLTSNKIAQKSLTSYINFMLLNATKKNDTQAIKDIKAFQNINIIGYPGLEQKCATALDIIERNKQPLKVKVKMASTTTTEAAQPTETEDDKKAREELEKMLSELPPVEIPPITEQPKIETQTSPIPTPSAAAPTENMSIEVYMVGIIKLLEETQRIIQEKIKQAQKVQSLRSGGMFAPKPKTGLSPQESTQINETTNKR